MRKALYLLLIGLLLSPFAGTAAGEAGRTTLANPHVSEKVSEPQVGTVGWNFVIIIDTREVRPGDRVQWEYRVENSPESTDDLVLDFLKSSMPEWVKEISWEHAELPPEPVPPGGYFVGKHAEWLVDASAPIGALIEGELYASALAPAEPPELSDHVTVKVTGAGEVSWNFVIIVNTREARPGEWVQWEYRVDNSPESTDALVVDSLWSDAPEWVDEVSWDNAELPPDLAPGDSFVGKHAVWHVNASAPIGALIEGELYASALAPAEPPELSDHVMIEVTGVLSWSFIIIINTREARPGDRVQWEYRVDNFPESTDDLVLDFLKSSTSEWVEEISWEHAELPPEPVPPGGYFVGKHAEWLVDASAPIGAKIEGELYASALSPAEPPEYSHPVMIEVVAGNPGSIHGLVTDAGTGKPIKWALIIATNREIGRAIAFTDGNGLYKIPDLEPAQCWVMCWKKGYNLGIKKAEVLPGEATQCDFVLSPK